MLIWDIDCLWTFQTIQFLGKVLKKIYAFPKVHGGDFVKILASFWGDLGATFWITKVLRIDKTSPPRPPCQEKLPNNLVFFSPALPYFDVGFPPSNWNEVPVFSFDFISSVDFNHNMIWNFK